MKISKPKRECQKPTINSVPGLPTVSVIIPTYNGGRYLGATLDSVFRQTFTDLEVIVVDDGSTEDLQGVLRPYAVRLRYVYSRNRGPAAARNLGFKLSHGKYVAFLDHDDLWSPTNLEKKVRILERNPRCGMVYSHPDLIDAHGGIIPHEHPPFYPQGRVFEDFLQRNHIPTFSATLIRREVIEEVGLLDERRAVMTCDDYDLWLKIADVAEVHFSPGQDVYYRVHSGNLVNNMDQNLQAHMIVFQEALKSSHSVQAIPVQKLSDIIKQHCYEKYHTFANRYYYEQGDYRKACALWWRCLTLKPFELRTWIYWGICLLPRGLIDVLRNIKRGMGKTL